MAFEFCFFNAYFFLLFYFILYFYGVSSFFYDLFYENEAGSPKIVDLNLLVVASANYAKYSCCKASSAEIRLAGSYSNSLYNKLTNYFGAFGSNFYSPIPFF
jgi:hypothetical protein